MKKWWKIDNEYIKMCTKCDHVHIEKKEPRVDIPWT